MVQSDPQDRSTALRVIGNEKQKLPCKLTDAELQSASDDLARAVQDLIAESLRQMRVKEEMKSKLADLESRRDALALVVVRKEENRPVDVEVQLISGADGLVTVRETRMDTCEVIATRPATEEEGQLWLLGCPACVARARLDPS